jgi:hypothetical protein
MRIDGHGDDQTTTAAARDQRDDEESEEPDVFRKKILSYWTGILTRTAQKGKRISQKFLAKVQF